MERELREALAAALVLQQGWGADEALDDEPVSRLAARAEASSIAVAARERDVPSVPRQPAPAGPSAEAEALAAAASDLATLRAAIAGFAGLALRETATNLVFADGNPDAPLMLIGEAPGAEEDREGKPFVGASGRLLDRMLLSVGLDRHGTGDGSFYITNILNWRPPGNRNPTDSEIALSLPFIRRHVALIRPRLILLLGAVSVRSLTGAREGITRLRGRWMTLEVEGMAPMPALATLHPAYLLRNPGAKKDAWSDLIALRRRMIDMRQH